MNSTYKTAFRLAPVAGMLIYSISTPTFSQTQIVSPDSIGKSAEDAKDGRNPAMPLNAYADKLTSARRPVKTSNKPYAPIKPTDDHMLIPEIEMFVGETRVFPSPNIGRIAVGNGQIMTAAAIDDKEVIVFANAAGTSSLFIWNKDGRYQRIKLNIVAGDTNRIAREVAAFLTTIRHSKSSIVGDKVIVEGDNLSDADLLKIEQLEKRYPQIVNFTNRVGWEQMVMMDVKVVEFPKSELTEIGLKWGATGGAAIGGIWGPIRRGSDGPYQVNIQTGQNNAPPITNPSGSGSVAVPSGLNILNVINLGLNAQLNLLEQNGKASVLAEPQLSARNGAKASFLAGGEFPYSVSNISGTTVLFKPYGVKLEIVPKVDRNGIIRATIEAEVSSIDASVSTPAGPALLTRRTNTEFNVRSGETMVLSGLLQRNASTDIDKVPLLGDIPILGALFRSKRFQNKETELVIFVTPTVIDSHSPGLVDRVERTTNRLQQNLGKQPYLTDPLQPGHDMSKPNVSPVVLEPKKDVSAADNMTAPQPATVQQISSTAPSSKIVSPVVELIRPSLLRIKSDGLAIRREPNISSPLLLRLGRGAIVEALPMAASKAPGQISWTAVRFGEIKGWAASNSLEANNVQLAPAKQSDVARTDRSVGNPRVNTGVQTAVTANKVTKGSVPLYHVNLDNLALRIAPDVNAKAIGKFQAGDIVEALPQPSQGSWTAVKHGGQTGWVITEWIERE